MRFDILKTDINTFSHAMIFTWNISEYKWSVINVLFSLNLQLKKEQTSNMITAVLLKVFSSYEKVPLLGFTINSF